MALKKTVFDIHNFYKYKSLFKIFITDQEHVIKLKLIRVFV